MGMIPSFNIHNRDLQLDVSSEIQYSNLLLSPSSNSSSSSSNMCHRGANSSPEINIQENCLGDVDNPSSSLSQGDVFFGVHANLNRTFIAKPEGNENLNGMSIPEMGSEKSQEFSEITEDGRNNSVTSPDSAGMASQPGSCETSRLRSTENDCFSLSSGDMVMRSNSFCLEDHSLLVVSSLEETSMSFLAGHPAMASKSNLLSTSLMDDCKKSPESDSEKSTGHCGLGTTFILAEQPMEENDSARSDCLVALPNEGNRGLLMTFDCETPPADCGTEAQFASKEEQLLNFPAVFTPEQGKTVVSTLSAVQDTDKDIHTSTPIQNNCNTIASRPSFSESPFHSGLHAVKKQEISITSNPLEEERLSSASKFKKMAIKKFPKSDFSNVKSKVVSRNGPQMSVPGTISQHKASHANLNNKDTVAHKGATIRNSPAKVRSCPAVVSTTSKIVSGFRRQGNTKAADLSATMMMSSMEPAVDRQSKSAASPPYSPLAGNKDISSVQNRVTAFETDHAFSNQVADNAAHQIANENLCLSALQKSLDGQTDQKQTSKKVVSNKIEDGSGSALSQEKLLVLNTRPQCSLKGSSSLSRPAKEKKTPLRLSTSYTILRADTHLNQTKPGNLKCSSQNKETIRPEAVKSPSENSTRDFKKINLVAESSKSKSAGASWSQSKSRFQGLLTPRRIGGTPQSKVPAASPMTASLSTRQRKATLGKEEGKASRDIATPQYKQKSSKDCRTPQTVGKASLGTIKLKLNRLLPPQTPVHPSSMGLPATPVSRIPRKTQGSSKSHSEVVHAEQSEVSGGAACKQTAVKTNSLKARFGTSLGKSSGQSLTTTSKLAALTSQGASNSTASPLKRCPSAKCVRTSSSGPVDRNILKASSSKQPSQQRASQPIHRNGPPDVVPANVAGAVRKDQRIQQLGELLAASNCRFEAVAIVLQQTLAERDEARRQCSNQCQELVNLRGELVSSVLSSERLEKEKEELIFALKNVPQKLQEQHQKDLAELEHSLQVFYQAEWDKLHLTYQEQTDKCKTLMQQQLQDLKANHEAMKWELENSHTEQLQCVKQQYETSLKDLCNIHNGELQSLDKSLKDTERTLFGQIEALTADNNAMIEKIAVEERRRKKLAEKGQKDSHTLYLEQELESLKVVLDIKNKQLHQQEKKLTEITKLRDKNVQLDESFTKVQQENEELRARMDRHAALSRQLSTEQAVLHESLQKESKVNKRLSMENEELMWKLHNSDLSSPRRASPTSASPSHVFSLQSPRSSGLYSSPPMTPK